jgi:tellurite resistance protein
MADGLGWMVALGAAAWLIGRKVKSGKAGKASPPAPSPMAKDEPSRPTPTSPPRQALDLHREISTRGAQSNASARRTAPRQPPRWIPPGETVQIAGMTIPGGMLYVGPASDSWSAPKCLIDPDQKVARSQPDTSGMLMGYWPSYSQIRPESRLAYLQWLAGGRNAPNANIGYVFLFFYGLERRLIRDRALTEADMIVAEVERLRGIYGGNNSFRGYSTGLLEAVELLRHANIDNKPPLRAEPSYDLPPRLLIGLGRQLADGKSLDADWTLAWALAHPETRLRTPARRAFDEFCRLYRLRFTERYPAGLKVSTPKTTIGALPYRCASADFQAELSGDFSTWPSVARLTKPVAQAREIVEQCMEELEPYSRFLGRSPDAADTLQAKMLLPAPLLNDAGSEVAAVRAWLPHTPTAISVSDAFARLGLSGEDAKPTKTQARTLAESLERLGHGVDPDVRLGGRTPKTGEKVVLFPLPAGTVEQPPFSPAYAAATLVLSLCALVAHADSVITPEEERHLLALVETNLHLSPLERARLEAHARWLLAVPPSLSQIQSRLTGIAENERHDLGRFAIALVAADGHVAVEEVKVLEKLYKLLNLDPKQVFSDIHALEAADDEPVVVRPATDTGSGRRIPAPPSQAPTVALDMARIERIRADTAKVSTLLTEIFVDDFTQAEPPPPLPADTPSVFDGLDRRHEALLRELSTRPDWPRADFDQLCRSMDLLPDGALENLNEWAFDRFDEALAEDGDTITLNLSLLETGLAA